MEPNIYNLIQTIGKMAEQAGMSAKEFSNYLEALALSQTVDNRLYGHADGAFNTASGHYSHAEGAQTIGYNAYPRIEGYHNCNCDAFVEQIEMKIDDINVEEWSWLDRDDTNK